MYDFYEDVNNLKYVSCLKYSWTIQLRLGVVDNTYWIISTEICAFSGVVKFCNVLIPSFFNS